MLLNVKQTAEKLNIRPITVYKMIPQKRLPVTRIGRRVLFDEAILDKWIPQKTEMPISD